MSLLVGIDEVGRGCWAGPVVAAAVVLDHDFAVSKDGTWKLMDSKLLTRKERELADSEIRKVAAAIGIGWVSAAQVDKLGLTESVRLAMRSALDHISVDYDEVIIDGHYNFLAENPKASALIRADSLVPAVSAASIIAKVARDNYMLQASKTYAGYGFDQHVGYGTRLHRDMLKRYGICELHRRTYKPVRAIMGQA